MPDDLAILDAARESLRLVASENLIPDEATELAYRPVITCRACSNSDGRVCDRHRKGECQVCGSWITQAHTHLSYTSHATITAVLLRIDPLWEWLSGWADPDEHGNFPVGMGPWALCSDATKPLSLLGRLSLSGFTRPGIGTVSSWSQENTVKELIGDLLRNCAMRFGIHLGLWTGAVEAPPPRMRYRDREAGSGPTGPPPDPRPAEDDTGPSRGDSASVAARRTAIQHRLLAIPESSRGAAIRGLSADFGSIGSCPAERLDDLARAVEEMVELG